MTPVVWGQPCRRVIKLAWLATQLPRPLKRIDMSVREEGCQLTLAGDGRDQTKEKNSLVSLELARILAIDVLRIESCAVARRQKRPIELISGKKGASASSTNVTVSCR